MRIDFLVSEAEILLRKNPRDVFHDLDHHLRVWSTAQHIMKSVDKEVNKEALRVAVMWHDVMLKNKSLKLGNKGLLKETISYLRELMDKQGCEDYFKQTVIGAIQHHNFGVRKQVNLEGKILFDADKLDALDPRRYRKLMAAITKKKMSKIQIWSCSPNPVPPSVHELN